MAPTPGGEVAWAETRRHNLTGFCEPILKDVKTVLALQRRAAQLTRRIAAQGASRQPAKQRGKSPAELAAELAALPRAMLLR